MAASDEDESPIDIVTIIVGCFIGVLVWSVISYIGGSSKKQSKQSQSQKQQPKQKQQQKQQPKQAAKPSKKEQKKQQANQPKKAVHSTYVPEPPKKKPTGDISNLGEMVTLSSRGAAAAIGATHTIDPFEVDDGGWNDVVKKEKKKKPKPSGGAGGPHAPFMPDDGPKEKIVFNTLQRLPAGKYQVNIQLNRESVLTVIGKGGMTIKNLRQKTNAEIQIDRLNEVCEITGKDTQVKKAQHAIQLLISSQAKTTIELGQHVPAIIGKGGEVIKAIRARSGAQLDIDKLTNCCDLSGTKDQVAKAQMLIEEIIGRANAAIADHTSDLIMVEPGHIPLIIGKGGLTIRAFQERSGARFDIDRNSSEITISGSSAQVATAKQMIEEHIDANSHSYVFLLGDDSQKKMAILGKKGATIRGIQMDSGAKLDLESDDLTGSSCLEISGSKHQVDMAKRAVEKIVNDIDAGLAATLGAGEVIEEIELGAYLPHVIGRGGGTIKRICEESHPDPSPTMKARMQIKGGGTLCQIAGSPDAVQRALGAVEAIIDQQQEMEEKRAAIALKQREAMEAAQAAALASGAMDGGPVGAAAPGPVDEYDWDAAVLGSGIDGGDDDDDQGWGNAVNGANSAVDDGDWGGSATAAGW